MNPLLKTVFRDVVGWVVGSDACELYTAQSNGSRGGMVSFSSKPPKERARPSAPKVIEVLPQSAREVVLLCSHLDKVKHLSDSTYLRDDLKAFMEEAAAKPD